jgi:hypothetical protein
MNPLPKVPPVNATAKKSPPNQRYYLIKKNILVGGVEV